jgi:trimethylamine---corrinoid protein Co-methyltransferase
MLAGASCIYGPGMLEAGMTFDLAQFVIDNELIAMTRFLRNGIRVSDATTAIDEIMAVGPAGNFLELDSTLKHARELSNPKLIHRNVREAWEAEGRPDFYEQARKEAKRLLAEHEVEPLPDDVTAEIHRLAVMADEKYAHATA